MDDYQISVVTTLQARGNMTKGLNASKRVDWSTWRTVVIAACCVTDCVRRADIDKYRLDFEVAIPYLHTHGDYKIDGRVLVLPISGSGDSWSNYSEYNTPR